MSQTSIDVVRSLYDAFQRGDIQAVLGALDPNIEWWEADNFIYADGNPYLGPQAVLEGVLMRLGTEWLNFKLTVARMLDAGEDVTVLGRYSGTCKATGARVAAQFAHIWTLRGGKPVRFQQYTDTAQFL